MSKRSKQESAWSAATRVTGVATEQTVGTGSALVGCIIVSNGDAATQTVTIKDGTTTLMVLSVLAGDHKTVPLNLMFATSVKITPSDANLDILVLYDD